MGTIIFSRYTVLPFQTLGLLEIYTFFKLICVLACMAIYLRKGVSDTHPAKRNKKPVLIFLSVYDGAGSHKRKF